MYEDYLKVYIYLTPIRINSASKFDFIKSFLVWKYHKAVLIKMD